MTDKAKTRLTGLLVAVLAALCFLPGIWGVPLFDRDETRFSEAAREMLVRHDYMVPYLNGEYRLHKPVLIYWVMAGAYKVFGVNEFGARVGSVLAGIGTCVLVFLLARRMFGLRTGALAGVAMATTLIQIVEARAATVDSVQLLFVMLCFLQLWRIYQGERRWDAYVLLYGGIALGWLTKGPIVVGVVLLAVAGMALMDRSLALVKRLHLIPGLVVSAAIPALWFFPANARAHGALVRVMLGHQMLGPAFGGTFEGHSGGSLFFLYYVVLLPVTFFPWIAALPLGAWRTWVAPEGRKARTFLLAWAVAPFIMFSFLKTKLPHYTLPGYPALAIMVAFGLEEAIRQRRAVLPHWTGKLGFGLFAVVGLVTAFGFAVCPYVFGLQRYAMGFLAVAVLLAVMVAFVLADLLRQRNGLLAVDLAAGAAILALTLWLGLLPPVARMMVPGRLKAGLARVVRPGDRVISRGIPDTDASLIFYAGRLESPAGKRPVTFTHDWQDVEKELATTRRFVCVAPRSQVAKMPEKLRGELQEVGHVSAFRARHGANRWEEFVFLRPKPPAG